MDDYFGLRLKKLRKLRGSISQVLLAEAAGMQRTHISTIERGEILWPEEDTQRRIADGLAFESYEAFLEAMGMDSPESFREAPAETSPLDFPAPDDAVRRICDLAERVDWTAHPQLYHGIIGLLYGLSESQE